MSRTNAAMRKWSCQRTTTQNTIRTHYEEHVFSMPDMLAKNKSTIFLEYALERLEASQTLTLEAAIAEALGEAAFGGS